MHSVSMYEHSVSAVPNRQELERDHKGHPPPRRVSATATYSSTVVKKQQFTSVAEASAKAVLNTVAAATAKVWKIFTIVVVGCLLAVCMYSCCAAEIKCDTV